MARLNRNPIMPTNERLDRIEQAILDLADAIEWGDHQDMKAVIREVLQIRKGGK